MHFYYFSFPGKWEGKHVWNGVRQPELFKTVVLAFNPGLKTPQHWLLVKHCGGRVNVSYKSLKLWLVWLSGVSASLWARGSLVRFPVGAHGCGAWSHWRVHRGVGAATHWCFCPSFFLPSPLSKKKKKKKLKIPLSQQCFLGFTHSYKRFMKNTTKKQLLWQNFSKRGKGKWSCWQNTRRGWMPGQVRLC